MVSHRVYKDFDISGDDGSSFRIRAYSLHGCYQSLKRRASEGKLNGKLYRFTFEGEHYRFDADEYR